MARTRRADLTGGNGNFPRSGIFWVGVMAFVVAAIDILVGSTRLPSFANTIDRPFEEIQLKTTSIHELEVISDRIYGPDAYGNPGCLTGCGCKQDTSECPQHYTIEDIKKSAMAILDTNASMYLAHQMERHHIRAIKDCSSAGQKTMSNGGWCLGQLKRTDGYKSLQLPDGRNIPIPKHHALPSERVGVTLEKFIKAENILSISDFGAGVGQYGVYLKSRIPDLVYYGYDGAGDIESYTSGFVKFSDFTKPLDLYVTEWVISLEVGEHIPSKFEGMYVRNLHRHNCRGVILSWAVLNQGGLSHINLHSNEYITNIFGKLGYERDTHLEEGLREPELNHPWFVRSALAFRRRNPTCGKGSHRGNIISPENTMALNSYQQDIVPAVREYFNLQKAPAADRDFPDVTVDLSYTLNVPSDWWDDVQTTSPSYSQLMNSLHGKDIWKDDRLPCHLESLGIVGISDNILGSPLRGPIEDLLRQHKPKIFLEVGVFNGATSTKVAKFFNEEKGFQNSYVLSMDSWLLDLSFVWNGMKSNHHEQLQRKPQYFQGDRLAGGNLMYYQFLANCIATNTTDRIIPLPTASANGAMALLSHGVRPDFMYIDASHANPDVFIDYENFYKNLRPGGVMTFDDIEAVEATKVAFHTLAGKYGLERQYLNQRQGYIIKKEDQDGSEKGPAKARSSSHNISSTTYELSYNERASSHHSCNQKADNTPLGATPVLIMIGFQKSGTTAFRELLKKEDRVCVSKQPEPSYWSRGQFALNDYPTCKNIYIDFVETQFGHCFPDRKLLKASHINNIDIAGKHGTAKYFETVLFAKAPTLAMQPWVAPSLKSNLPEAKILFLVKDPIERAFSGFIQGWKWIREAPSLKIHNQTHPTAKIFDSLVGLEISISKQCGIPNGKATGYADADWPIVYRFNQCCRMITEKKGHKAWPGCDGYGMKNVPKNKPMHMHFPRFQKGNDSGLPPSRGLGWQLTPFGGYSFNFVREGAYIDNIHPWIQLYGSENIHAYAMDELESDKSMLVSKLLDLADARSQGKSEDNGIKNNGEGNGGNQAMALQQPSKVLTDESLFAALNATQMRKKIGFVPHIETITMLKEYYQMKNEELNRVFQKNLLLKYEEARE